MPSKDQRGSQSTTKSSTSSRPSKSSSGGSANFQRMADKDPEASHDKNHVFGSDTQNETVVIAVRLRNQSNDVITTAGRQAKGGQVTHKMDGKAEFKYAFDFVFPMDCQNFDIWSTICRPCVDKILKGQNAAIFAYGGTGSGKSYTMGFEKGGPSGQLHYAVDYLFKKIADAKSDLSVYITYFEIYGCAPGSGQDNAEITDLFSANKNKPKGNDQSRLLSQLEHIRIKSPKEFFGFFNQANDKRQVGAQGFNSKSSRSHAIVQIMVAANDFITTVIKGPDFRGYPKQPIPWAKLSVIDLAGSEPANLWYSKTDKSLMHRYNEAVVINQGLGALKNSMAAMAKPKSGVTNRNASTLTRMLGDLLDKSSQGFLRVIATVNPISQEGKVAALSRGTLDYAKEIKAIKLQPGVERDLFALAAGVKGEVAGTVGIETLRDRIAPNLGIVSAEMVKRRQQKGKGGREGQHVYDNGSIYQGSFNGLLRHGKGQMRWLDGTSFTGVFENDMATGPGQYNHVNGDVYKGGFLKDLAHGEGTYSQADGSVYTGGWKADKKEGKGHDKWTNDSYYKGMFKEGMRHGPGFYVFPNGCSYKGTFRGNQMEGKGLFKYPDKSTYEGEWKSNMMNGTGTYKYPDGKVYQGEYRDNVRHGQGSLTDPKAKTQYTGGWAKGQQHGKGEIIADGRKEKGEWKKGARIK